MLTWAIKRTLISQHICKKICRGKKHSSEGINLKFTTLNFKNLSWIHQISYQWACILGMWQGCMAPITDTLTMIKNVEMFTFIKTENMWLTMWIINIYICTLYCVKMILLR